MIECVFFLLRRSSVMTVVSGLQKVFDIIHPNRRNLTAIRGYARLGGLPDNPRTDPQDRTWFGPHDRLFTEEESEPLEFVPGPEHGQLFCLSPGLLLISLLQYGAGDGMVRVISTDRMSTLFGRRCQIILLNPNL